MNRGHRAIVPGVHRLHHVERFRPADFADDDAVRPHPQRVAQEIALADLAVALEIGGPRLQRDDVRLLQLEFGSVLDGDDALAGSINRERALRSVVLPEPVPPEMMMFRRQRAAICKSARRVPADMVPSGHKLREFHHAFSRICGSKCTAP